MARPSKKTTQKRISQSVDAFSISLQLGGDLYSSSGTTPLEALQSLFRPQKITTKGILNISHGENKRELVLQPMQVKRLFYPIAQKFLAKQLTFGL